MHHSKFHSLPSELNIKHKQGICFVFFLEGFLQGPSSVFPLFFFALSVNPGVNRPPPYIYIYIYGVRRGMGGALTCFCYRASLTSQMATDPSIPTPRHP